MMEACYRTAKEVINSCNSCVIVLISYIYYFFDRKLASYIIIYIYQVIQTPNIHINYWSSPIHQGYTTISRVLLLWKVEIKYKMLKNKSVRDVQPAICWNSSGS